MFPILHGFFEEDDQIPVVRRIERVFRDRQDVLHFSDTYLLRYFRFPRQEIIYLCDLLEPIIGAKTDRSHSIPTVTKVLASLAFFASGSFQHVVGRIVGVSQPSCSRILAAVLEALKRLAPTHIVYPLGDPQKIAQLKTGFGGLDRFPNVIGAIDCCHVAIKAPTEEEWTYVDLHHKHSINFQAICDNKLTLMNIVVKWPGSTHDSFIWQHCHVKRSLDTGLVPNGWLLGDSGYPLQPHLMTPIRNPTTPPEIAYNSSHSKTRNPIERCFGVLKSRFRCIHQSGGVLEYTPSKCKDIIVAVCVLHNLCINRNIPLLDPPPPVVNQGVHYNGVENVSGFQIRRQLIDERFS